MKKINIIEAKEENKEKEDSKEPEAQDSEISEIGNWVRVSSGWFVHFHVGNVQYTLSLSPIDPDENHWKFTYFKYGQRNNPDINKFGQMAAWASIWKVIMEILKDFVRIFRPTSIKFIGMSLSKRGIYYREIFKIYQKNYLNSFRKLGYHSNFDYKNIEYAPSFTIKKGSVQKKENGKDEVKQEKSDKKAE